MALASNTPIPESALLDYEDEPLLQRAPFDLITFLIVVYLFWFFTTPYLSNRLAILGTLKFERILAIALLGLTVVGGRITQLFSGVSVLVGAMFGFMLVSFLVSSYPDYPNSIHWADTYWKKLVFFLIVGAGLRETQHLDRVLKGVVCVILFYQIISWLDFMRGGSFVYQQGMKRMIGTWSGGGYGAANQYGLLCAFALPFIYHWFKTSGRRDIRLLMLGAGGLSMMSILFSGTRGALVVAVAYLGFTFRKAVFKPKIVLSLALIGACAIPALPGEVKYRYWDLMISVVASSEPKGDLDRYDKIAIDSGRGRLTGMINGFQLGMNKPLLGYGPGASPVANFEVLGFGHADNMLQLHNIYGQIAAEIGLVGMALWLLLIMGCVAKLWRLRKQFGYNTKGQSICSSLIGGLFVMLSYGFFSHSFYDVKWLFLFGAVVAIGSFTWDEFAYESTESDDGDFEESNFDEDENDGGSYEK